MDLIGHTPDYSGFMGDKRLERRARLISQSLLMSKTSVVHSATKTETEQKGFYRFLGNDNVKEDFLIEELCFRCGKNAAGRDVLVIQDSSSFGFSGNAHNIKAGSGFGLVGNKAGYGFLSHTSLVLDAGSESLLGFCDVQLWHRREAKSNNTTGAYKQQRIEEKESNKWLKATAKAKENLAGAKSITIIQDREGDIYEQFCLLSDTAVGLIVRSRDNRRLSDGSRLYDRLAAVDSAGTYSIQVYGDIRKNRVTRVAELTVKYTAVTIEKPRSAKTAGIAENLRVYVVEVKETGNTSKEAICWRLLSMRPVSSFEEATAVVNCYKQRWYIEQLFRLLKKQGYQLESSGLETGWAIRKLFVLVLNAALRVMQLYLAYGEEDCQNTNEVFSEQEMECLQSINSGYLKKTSSTENPFNPAKLSWASWIIARLGGWKGNPRQRAAGPIIIKKGLDQFESMFAGWKLAREVT